MARKKDTMSLRYNEVSMFELLATKDVYAILDGDAELRTDPEDTSLKMPYLSGPTIVDISNMFGLPCNYPFSGAASRWMYMDDLYRHCLDNNRVPELLGYLFDSTRFGKVIQGLEAVEAKQRIQTIQRLAIDRINVLLLLSGYELKNVSGNFFMTSSNSTVPMDTPTLRAIDRDYVSSLAERIKRDIDNQELDSAITKSRTLLEEVFCFVIEEKDEVPSDKGDISKLYGQVKSLYSMHQSANMDKRINALLSGLEKIVSAVAEMRNKNSDAHGVGQKRVTIQDYHARLMANSAVAMADFILSVANNASNHPM